VVAEVARSMRMAITPAGLEARGIAGLTIACDRCSRRGVYAVTRLIEQHGRDHDLVGSRPPPAATGPVPDPGRPRAALLPPARPTPARHPGRSAPRTGGSGAGRTPGRLATSPRSAAAAAWRRPADDRGLTTFGHLDRPAGAGAADPAGDCMEGTHVGRGQAIPAARSHRPCGNGRFARDRGTPVQRRSGASG
jgi:hypothetical protein